MLRIAANDNIFTAAPARSFGEAISVCLGKYATFTGRASRSEFWYFMLFMALVLIAASLVDVGLLGFDPQGAGAVLLLAHLGLTIPALSVAFRRLQDTDRSGSWALLYLAVTFAYGPAIARLDEIGVMLLSVAVLIWVVTFLVWLCRKSTPGPNRFG